MTDIGWYAAVVVLMGVIWFLMLERRQEKREHTAAVRDLNDRLMAKVPDHYFAVRMEEDQMKFEAENPKPEEVDPLMYNVGPRP